MATMLIAALTLVVAAHCSVVPTAESDGQYTEFAYNVADPITGDYKSQIETRSGGVVQGQYSLLESDGTRRTVDYAADSVNGFNAIVRKDPASVATAPAIAAPAPSLAIVAANTYGAPALVASRALVSSLVPSAAAASTPTILSTRTYSVPAVIATRTVARPAVVAPVPAIVAARTYASSNLIAPAPGFIPAPTLSAPTLISSIPTVIAARSYAPTISSFGSVVAAPFSSAIKW